MRAPESGDVPTPSSRGSTSPPPARLGDALRGRSVIRVLTALLLTRLVLFLVGACATRILPAASEPRVEAYLGKSLSLAAWVRWDAWWYLSVAERGYWFDQHGKSNVAFFPLFPLLIRLLEPVVRNPIAAGLLVANLASVASVLALWWWVCERAGPRAGERATAWLLVYPFAFFFHSVYAEALFFVLASLTLAAAGRGRWVQAGACGALAAATRPMGIFLVPALLWGVWSAARGQATRPRGLDVIAAMLPAAGLLAYMLFLGRAFGDPLAFWTAHAAGWDVRLQWIFASHWYETLRIVRRLWRVQGYTSLLDASRVILPPVFVVLSVQAYRRLGPAAGVYAGLATAVAILFASESVGREFLAVVPAFAVLVVVGPTGGIGDTLRLCSLGFLFMFLFAFVTGHFVG